MKADLEWHGSPEFGMLAWFMALSWVLKDEEILLRMQRELEKIFM